MIITRSLVDCYASLNICSLELNLGAWVLRYKHLGLTSKLTFLNVAFSTLDRLTGEKFPNLDFKQSRAYVEDFQVRRAREKTQKLVSEFQLRTNNGHTCIEFLEGLDHNLIY